MPLLVSIAARRLPLAFVAFASLGGCAGSAQRAHQKELAELRAELRTVRVENERLEKRVSRLEGEAAVAGARQGSPAPQRNFADTTPTPEAADGHGVPQLEVVKLQPREGRLYTNASIANAAASPTGAAPAVPIRAQVREPSEEELEDVLSGGDAPQSTDVSPVAAGAAEALFERGMSALRTGDPLGAVTTLKDFAARHPRHAHADNALHYGGVGLMAAGDLEGASRLFERVLSEYPAGDARMDAMLKLAECRAKLDRRDDARALYQKLIQTWPGTPAATQAQQRLAGLGP